MAKQSGLGDNFYVDTFNLSGDVGSIQRVATPRAVLETTGIDKSAFERLPGKRDGGMDWSSWFNDAAGQAHLGYRPLTTSDRVVSYFRGTTLGNPAASMVAKQLNYDPTRGEDGSLSFSLQGLANAFGLDWGRSLTAGVRTDTTATNGTGVDHTASTAFGLQAYLHVFAFTGTSATIKLQESADNGGGDPYADVTGGAFASVTGATQERIATSLTQTIERWLRVVTTGTFSNVQFAVMVAKNEAATVY